jgi:hypothetical protein
MMLFTWSPSSPCTLLSLARWSRFSLTASTSSFSAVARLAEKKIQFRNAAKRRPALAVAVAVMMLALSVPQTGYAQLGKANQILLNRGLQLQGMCEWDDYFHLDTYSNANYTSINWLWTSNPSLMGPPPGFPWSRWVQDETKMPPQSAQGDETPYLNQLVSLQLADEWNLGDDAVRTRAVDWFNSVRSNWPNTILYANNYGGQASDSALGDFVSRAHPDMLCFDVYPFLSDYTTRIPIPGPFTSWLSELRRYRQWGISANIPFATYMQIFHSVEDYDQRVYRYPSPSELRFNNFAALAFNAKVLLGFTYNTGAAVLFDILPNGYSGDIYTNALYGEQADINHRAVNLGKALVCLKPIADLHNPNAVNPPPGPASTDVNFPDGITTSIMILKGNPGTDSNTPEPISFVDDPQAPRSYSWWEANKNDPYLNGWAVINKGTNNAGLPGQVIISWFKPMDESFDGPNYTNEVYMMVVNALTATNGTAADCLQQIKLNFLVGTTITNVNMLDPVTGLVTTNTMPVITGTGSSTKRQLVLDLNGGDAALFKFADGAPFVGHVPPAAARVSGQMRTNTPALNIQGTVGARYQVQTATSLTNPNWQVLTSLLLTSTNYLFLDTISSTTTNIFYRAVGIP